MTVATRLLRFPQWVTGKMMASEQWWCPLLSGHHPLHSGAHNGDHLLVGTTRHKRDVPQRMSWSDSKSDSKSECLEPSEGENIWWTPALNRPSLGTHAE